KDGCFGCFPRRHGSDPSWAGGDAELKQVRNDAAHRFEDIEPIIDEETDTELFADGRFVFSVTAEPKVPIRDTRRLKKQLPIEPRAGSGLNFGTALRHQPNAT